MADDATIATAPKKTKNKAKTNVKAARMAESGVKVKSAKPRDKNVREAVAMFSLTTDETRIAILFNLANGSLNVGEICSSISNPSQPAVSHHLSLLRAGDVVETNRNGKFNYYSLTAKGKKLVKAVKSVAETTE